METNRRPVFPWYKERLQTRFLKAPAHKMSSVHRFENVSLDDFSVSSRDQSGVAPVIYHDSPKKNSGLKPKKSVSKEHACFSKQMIQKQLGREFVSAVEEKLRQHPLTLFPQYKHHMTAELFEKVASVLEPDVSVNSSSALPTPTGDDEEEEEEEEEPSKEEESQEEHGASSDKMDQTPRPRNPYVLQRKGNGTKKVRMVKVGQLSRT